MNPTRMEMARLKSRLKTAKRGHKLLKDKLDELMKKFLETVKETKDLRQTVEEGLNYGCKLFLKGAALMDENDLYEAFMVSERKIAIEAEQKNIMSVKVPVFKYSVSGNDIFPYGIYGTNGELDEALIKLDEVLYPLIELAQNEMTARLLAEEIEKTRRRVNALENVLIPNYEETIKYIVMKLEENERASSVRLMKIKDSVIKNNFENKNGVA